MSYSDLLGLFYRDRECVLQYVGIVLQGQEVYLTMIWWDCSSRKGSMPYNDMLGLFYRDRECLTIICWDCSTRTGSVSYNKMLGLSYRDRECVIQ